jgi:hypothetical protein
LLQSPKKEKKDRKIVGLAKIRQMAIENIEKQ